MGEIQVIVIHVRGQIEREAFMQKQLYWRVMCQT